MGEGRGERGGEIGEGKGGGEGGSTLRETVLVGFVLLLEFADVARVFVEEDLWGFGNGGRGSVSWSGLSKKRTGVGKVR